MRKSIFRETVIFLQKPLFCWVFFGQKMKAAIAGSRHETPGW